MCRQAKKAPLVQRGDRLPKAVRGDCKAGQTHSTWFYNPARKRSLAVPTRDRERSLGAAARRSPPCAKGGQTVADGQGGLTAVSVVNDTSRRAWASSAKCPQSLSRRSPTAPFAQGSRLCCSAYNQPPRVDNKKLPRWGSFFAFISVLSSSAEAQFGSGGSPQPPLCKGGTDRRRRSGGIVKLDKPTQLGSIAQRGSAVWPRRLAAAPLVQRGDRPSQTVRGD